MPGQRVVVGHWLPVPRVLLRPAMQGHLNDRCLVRFFLREIYVIGGGGLTPGVHKRLTLVIFFSPYGSSIILVLPASNIFTKFRRGQPLEALNTGGTKISRFSTNKSLYLANDTKYRHTYYGRRIGNRTQAFEWHQF